MKKIFGKITDYDGNPLCDADILIKNEKFEDIYSCKSDANGYYEMNVKEAIYFAIGIFKDYRTKYLEYWAWNVKVYDDIKIDAKIDSLEVYGMNAFIIQGAYPALSVYFRPMSLKRLQRLKNTGDFKTANVIDIAPSLTTEDITAKINGINVGVLQINTVKEITDKSQYMYAYLLQIALPQGFDKNVINNITLDIIDRETNEKGMGSCWI